MGNASWFQFTASAVEEPQVIRFYGMEITGLKRAEEELEREKEALRKSEASLEREVRDQTRELERSVRLYRMLSQCNQTWWRPSRKRTSFSGSAKSSSRTEDTRFPGSVTRSRNGAKSIRPIVSVGIDLHLLRDFGFVWADTEKGQGPTGTAIRENKVITWNHTLHPFVMLPDEELKSLAWYMSFPLAEPGKQPFGALTVASQQAREFEEAELSLFRELANDLSFGILALRAHAERAAALQSLELSNQQLHRLSSDLARAEQNERRQLAGVLHDEVQQILVGAKLRLECMEDENAKPCVDLLENCLRITRSLTSELCPPVLFKGNIVAVLDWLTQWSREKYGLDIQLVTTASQVVLSEDLIIMIYRSVQELLLNIAKHAKTREGKIEVSSAGGQVRIRVIDHGEGFDPSAVQMASADGGFGLFAVQERLVNRGCEFRIDSSPGNGSVFTILAPLAKEPEAAAP